MVFILKDIKHCSSNVVLHDKYEITKKPDNPKFQTPSKFSVHAPVNGEVKIICTDTGGNSRIATNIVYKRHRPTKLQKFCPEKKQMMATKFHDTVATRIDVKKQRDAWM